MSSLAALQGEQLEGEHAAALLRVVALPQDLASPGGGDGDCGGLPPPLPARSAATAREASATMSSLPDSLQRLLDDELDLRITSSVGTYRFFLPTLRPTERRPR